MRATAFSTFSFVSYASLVSLASFASLAGCADRSTESSGDVAAAARSSLSDRVEAATKAFEAAMYRCPDRVWPNIAENYRDRSQVLLVSQSAMKAFLWNDRGPQG